MDESPSGQGTAGGMSKLGRSMGAARLCALACWLSAVAVPSECSVPIFSGSLTWQVHPHFAAGVRQVEFTLDTSFEMDLSAASAC